MLQGGRWPEGAQVWTLFSCILEGLGPGRGALGSTQMQRRDPGEAGGDGVGAGWPLEKAGLQSLGEMVGSRAQGRQEWTPWGEEG